MRPPPPEAGRVGVGTPGALADGCAAPPRMAGEFRESGAASAPAARPGCLTTRARDHTNRDPNENPDVRTYKADTSYGIANEFVHPADDPNKIINPN